MKNKANAKQRTNLTHNSHAILFFFFGYVAQFDGFIHRSNADLMPIDQKRKTLKPQSSAVSVHNHLPTWNGRDFFICFPLLSSFFYNLNPTLSTVETLNYLIHDRMPRCHPTRKKIKLNSLRRTCTISIYISISCHQPRKRSIQFIMHAAPSQKKTLLKNNENHHLQLITGIGYIRAALTFRI